MRTDTEHEGRGSVIAIALPSLGALLLLVALAGTGPAIADSWDVRAVGEPVIVVPVRVAALRDFSISFDHDLGTAEAKRRVAARLEALRAQFAGKIGESSVTWNGDVAEIRVKAFGQTANAWVSVGDTNVQIHVHLPLLLSPLGGNIQAFLTKTARQALKP